MGLLVTLKARTMGMSVRHVYKRNVTMLKSCNAKQLILIFVVCVGINLLIPINFKALIFSSTSSRLESSQSEVFKDNDSLPYDVLTRVKKITNCLNKPLDTVIQQRGHFWVFYNYVTAERRFSCFESVTYTTQADYTFLDNVVPLINRWKGPISLALYAPGSDFGPTLDSIAYLRNCGKAKGLVKQFVTFHVFFNERHLPKNASFEEYTVPLTKMYKDTYDCRKPAPYEKNSKMVYKAAYNLTYPINVARNVARSTAQTHFVLASDIELYPSPHLINKFLKMVAQNGALFQDETPKIFVLPIFEVLESASVPNNKTTLQQMMKQKRAFSFHERLCKKCHAIPNATQWINTAESDDLNVFVTIKRQGQYRYWEAFYIGTQQDPLFDERLSWEGQSNKMTQGYVMCLLNYDYMVLDNAFLTHKPGIKKEKLQLKVYSPIVRQTNYLITHYIQVELTQIYGQNRKCIIH